MVSEERLLKLISIVNKIMELDYSAIEAIGMLLMTKEERVEVSKHFAKNLADADFVY